MIPTTNAIHCQLILEYYNYQIATDNDVNIRILAPLNDYSVEQKVQKCFILLFSFFHYSAEEI